MRVQACRCFTRLTTNSNSKFPKNQHKLQLKISQESTQTASRFFKPPGLKCIVPWGMLSQNTLWKACKKENLGTAATNLWLHPVEKQLDHWNSNSFQIKRATHQFLGIYKASFMSIKHPRPKDPPSSCVSSNKENKYPSNKLKIMQP